MYVFIKVMQIIRRWLYIMLVSINREAPYARKRL
jgi:hypothetical protein